MWRICVHALEWNTHGNFFSTAFFQQLQLRNAVRRNGLADARRWRTGGVVGGRAAVWTRFFYDFLFYYCSWWWDVIVAPFKASYCKGQVTSDISDLGLLEDPGRTSSTVLSKATQTHICLLFYWLIFSKTHTIHFSTCRYDLFVYLYLFQNPASCDIAFRRC